jgi:hypothetical protein
MSKRPTARGAPDTADEVSGHFRDGTLRVEIMAEGENE